MKDYYNLFIQLSQQQCTARDYADKQKVKAHNKAAKEMQKLKKEMKQIDCFETLNTLLNHNDDRVRINAASLCLQMSIHIEKAIDCLKDIADCASDATMQFAAKMLLKSALQSE